MSRIFISFAMEDRIFRDFLIGQKKNLRTPFDFTDYSVKQPWDSNWKTNCRVRIKGCRGMIGIITRNTPNADGQLWELTCALQEGIPLLLIHGSSDEQQRLKAFPKVLSGRRVFNWTHQSIANFVEQVA